MFGEFWWIIPLGMMIFCFLMMWGRRGWNICGCGSHDHEQNNTGSEALEILEKRYAGGEIDKAEYEEKRKALIQKGEDNE